MTTASAPLNPGCREPTETGLLARRFEFTRMLNEMAIRLLNLSPDASCGFISQSLGRVARFLGFNLATIFQFSGRAGAPELTHRWAAGGRASAAAGIGELDVPWLEARLAGGRAVPVPTLDALPVTAQRDLASHQRLGIASAYYWPLLVGEVAGGWLSFASVGEPRPWPAEFDDEVQLLQRMLEGVLGSERTHWASLVTDLTERKQVRLALERSEAKYRKLHESMADAFVTVDMGGRILEFNRVYADMVGYTEDELRHRTYIDLTPERWHALEARLVAEQIVPHGFSEVYEKEYRRKDGTVFPVELRAFLVRDEAGQPAAMWAIVRDISERKRNEAEILRLNAGLEERVRERTVELERSNDSLHRSQALLQAVTDNSPDPIFLKDREGRLLFANPAAWAAIGAPESELLGKNDDEVPPEKPGLRLIRLADSQVLESGRTEVSEEAVDTAAGPRCYLVSRAPYRDAGGQIVGVVGIARDITKRKLAERSLQASEERFRTLFESAPVGISVHSPDGRCLQVNRAYAAMLGSPQEDLLRQGLPHLEPTLAAHVAAVPPQSRNRHGGLPPVQAHEGTPLEPGVPPASGAARGPENALCDGRGPAQPRQEPAEPGDPESGSTCEHRHVRPDGRPVWLRSVVSAVRATDGAVAYYICVAADVTAEKHAAESSRRLEKEILEISAREERRIGLALHDGLGVMLGGIAFKAKAMAETLRTRDFPQAPEAEALVHHLNHAMDQARTLARDLVAGEVELHGLSLALERACDDMPPRAGLTCSFAASGPEIRLEPAVEIHLYRIALEAVHNARRHARATRIEVALDFAPPQVCLTVRDDGRGFDPAHIERPGLGLGIMKYRAHEIEASLSIHAQPGAGTEIRCLLPDCGPWLRHGEHRESVLPG